MKVSMDRFREPTHEDSLALCQGCDETFHYEALNDNGLCAQCAPDNNEQDDEEKHE